MYIIYAFKSTGDATPERLLAHSKKIETRIQNRHPSSTKNSYREEESFKNVFCATVPKHI